jgi:HSF-type DNA-binding
LCGSFSNMFPSKLYALLMDAEANGLSHIVSFQPHGRAFKVHRAFMFESIVLPEYVVCVFFLNIAPI